VKIGSLCSGYGGLDMVACGHFNGTVAWYSEIEPAGVQVLSHHHPEARDIGDLTEVDWEQIEKVDVVTAGFPCQPVSNAGQRQGMEDERWLWNDIAKSLGILRPRYIVLENVPGLFTADDGDAMASVLHGLSLLGGYEYRWGVVRASDAGAPHKRARWFCLATDTTNLGYERGGGTRGRGDGSTNGDLGITHTPGVDGERAKSEGHRDRAVWENPKQVGCHSCGLPANAHGAGPQGPQPEERRNLPTWGRFGPAIEGWERVLGRPAPDPTDTGRLSSRFVEWMMGLPLGYVTDLGLSRTAELKLLGNGVVPQQGLLALNLLGQSPIVL